MKIPTSLVWLLGSAVLTAQDPPAPAGGFSATRTTFTIAFSDLGTTDLDIYLPTVAPGPNGWPGVHVMHGGGGHRRIPAVTEIGWYLAAAGYAVYAYDGRPIVDQERDFLDSVEVHGLAQAAVPGLIDPARLCVTGLSGGGRKSYGAAAWSGKPLPPSLTTSLVSTHPVVLAIAPEIAALDATEFNVPGGVMVADSAVVGKPSTDPWITAIAAGDFATLRNLIDTPFNQDLLAELQTSTVPILSMLAMQDFKVFGNMSIDALAALPPRPQRLFLSTGGHSTVGNTMERALMQDLRRRWFDRYAKGIQSGVDLEPLVEVGMQPASTAQHLNIGTTWEHRQSDTWQPPATTRLHLVGAQSLSQTPPAAVNLTNVVNHVVPVGYDINAYIDLGGPGPGAGLEPLTVLANIAPDFEDFATAPLPEDMELLGRPAVELTVSDTTGVFQLTAILGHVDPSNTTHWITAGTTGHRGGSPGVMTMRIELGDVGQIVPAGHRLRLRLTNVCDIDAPGSRRIRYVPYFSSTNTRLEIGPGNANWLDLPLIPYRPDLLPRLAPVTATGGFNHTMLLRGGAARAGQIYLTVVGCSGEAPGSVIGGLPAPINLDWCTGIAFGAVNTVYFPQNLGTLDAAGEGFPGFALPPAFSPLVEGFRFTFAGVVFDPAGAVEGFAGPATLVIEP